MCRQKYQGTASCMNTLKSVNVITVGMCTFVHVCHNPTRHCLSSKTELWQKFKNKYAPVMFLWSKCMTKGKSAELGVVGNISVVVLLRMLSFSNSTSMKTVLFGYLTLWDIYRFYFYKKHVRMKCINTKSSKIDEIQRNHNSNWQNDDLKLH